MEQMPNGARQNASVFESSKKETNNPPYRVLARPLCKRQLEHAYGRSEASHEIIFVCSIYNSLLQLIVLVLDLTRVLSR